MREKLKIADEMLVTCLREYYSLSAVALEFLPVGLDTWAGLYKVTDTQGAEYLLKVKAGALYTASCYVPRYLADQNIAAVVAPLATTDNALWAELGEWTMRVYPFIDGITSWQPSLNELQWQMLGASLLQIHHAPTLVESWPDVRQETFDPTAYANFITSFEAEQPKILGGNSLVQEFRAGWTRYQPTIRTFLAAMEKLETILQRQKGNYVVCHADLHPGNLIRTASGQVFIIDWDEVMLAPKERDFLFVDTEVAQEQSAFFAGYGETAIDWAALTYYRCERVVQDLIACAQDIVYRNDLEIETKQEALQLFENILGGDGEAETAFATAQHLPPELSFSKPKNS